MIDAVTRTAFAARAPTAPDASLRAAAGNRTLPICQANCVIGANAIVKASA